MLEATDPSARVLGRTFGNAMREFALSIGKRDFFTFGEASSYFVTFLDNHDMRERFY